MECHALVGVGAIFQVVKVVSEFVKYQVAVGRLAGEEETEVVEYCPFVGCRWLFVSFRTDFDTEADKCESFTYNICLCNFIAFC